MNTIPGSAIRQWPLACALCIATGAASGEVLKGTVNDLGAPSQGIAGVMISIKDTRNNELAPGLTNEKGEYSVTFQLPAAGEQVKVLYQKPGYTPRPVIKIVADSGAPQERILLLRTGADDNYYRDAAIALNSIAGTSGKLRESAATVASLPGADKARLLRYVTATSPSEVLRAIEVADNDASLVLKVKAAMEAQPALKLSEINVETFKGVVMLSGFAVTPEAQAVAKTTASKVKGVEEVRSRMVK